VGKIPHRLPGLGASDRLPSERSADPRFWGPRFLLPKWSGFSEARKAAQRIGAHLKLTVFR